MTARIAFGTLTALLALVPAGCRRVSSTAAAGVGTVAPTDYRTLTGPEIEIIISDKTGSPVTLTAAGPNQYTGTRPSPDGTVQLPVTVTVEAERIVIETRGGGGLSSRQVITPRGLVQDDLRESPGR